MQLRPNAIARLAPVVWRAVVESERGDRELLGRCVDEHADPRLLPLSHRRCVVALNDHRLLNRTCLPGVYLDKVVPSKYGQQSSIEPVFAHSGCDVCRQQAAVLLPVHAAVLARLVRDLHAAESAEPDRSRAERAAARRQVRRRAR